MTSKEITFVKGDILSVFICLDSGWWFGSVVNTNLAGFFPKNYCNSLLINPSELSVNNFQLHEPLNNESKNLENEIALLRQQLALQNSLLQQEIAKRKKLETTITQHIDSFQWLLSPDKPPE